MCAPRTCLPPKKNRLALTRSLCALRAHVCPKKIGPQQFKKIGSRFALAMCATRTCLPPHNQSLPPNCPPTITRSVRLSMQNSWPTTLSQMGWTKARMTSRSTTLHVRLPTSLNIFTRFGGTSGKTSIQTQLWSIHKTCLIIQKES